jgi:ATP-binding cassette subfamily F protein 3
MSLLTASNIHKSYGAETVLSDVSLRLDWRQKLALVGRNGTGKSTLLKILTGQLEADKGNVSVASGVQIGYLRQEEVVDSTRTVYEEAEQAFAHVLQMESRLRELEGLMTHGSPEALEPIMAEYGHLHDHFEAMGGYENLRDIKLVLERLGFREADMEKSAASLSGGEKTRLAVARLLLSAPDVLFLDEPTNHLDLAATEWLEGFLRTFGGAVVVVSHDRRFLDEVVNSVAELDKHKITLYNGDFSAFWRQREERRTRQLEEYERNEAEIARLEEFWRRNKAGQNRNMAWSRLKAANRIREVQIERPTDAKTLQASISSSRRSGQDVVVFDRLSKQFGERVLFQDVSFSVHRGQRLGIIGANGTGKSTLVRILMGRDKATSGQARLGHEVTVGYFAQDVSELDMDSTVLENILSAGDLTVAAARGYLARFLFTGEDVYEKAGNLSGGEKNRLSLAGLALARPNLIVLDEPTNHLDMDSREALTEILQSYDGTLIMVSHDRNLLDRVTDTTLVLEPGKATIVDGNYSYWREKTQAAAAKAPSKNGTSAKPKQIANGDAPGVNPLTAGMNSYELSKARQKAVKTITKSEERVTAAEDWLKRIEECLSAPMPGDDIVKLSKDYEQAQAELKTAMKEWEDAVEYANGIGAAV